MEYVVAAFHCWLGRTNESRARLRPWRPRGALQTRRPVARLVGRRAPLFAESQAQKTNTGTVSVQ